MRTSVKVLLFFVGVILGMLLAGTGYVLWQTQIQRQEMVQKDELLMLSEPACDANVALRNLDIEPSLMNSANSSGTPNGVQIWFNTTVTFKIPTDKNIQAVDYPAQTPLQAYNRAKPGESVSADVITVYYMNDCR